MIEEDEAKDSSDESSSSSSSSGGGGEMEEDSNDDDDDDDDSDSSAMDSEPTSLNPADATTEASDADPGSSTSTRDTRFHVSERHV
jgi:hypothetical protein